ncbi:phosphatases II [Ascodesmis nigricans]|uniref:protein-tyrosine-phosphatase n=1 Tax=Ascodesmis nigricans TaxID=341454 RepID=A0A4V6RHH7_9PEZI|nr:phosphatases II [Ascodesmis nigricans]
MSFTYTPPTLSSDDEARLHIAASIASSSSSSSSRTHRPAGTRPHAAYSKVLSNGSLYLGNLRSAQDDHLLYKLKVTQVISIVSEGTALQIPKTVKHRRITLSDLPSEDLLAILPEATKLIDEALRTHEVVMVHCQHGLSRSASVVIGFLMMRLHWSLAATLDYLKQRHICVQPNPGFFEQLRVWEDQVNGPSPASML